MSALAVLAVVADAGVCALVRDVFRRAGDGVTALTDLSAGLSFTETVPVDLVFVDVGLGEGAALALVHQVKALRPSATVVAMARPSGLEAAAHAIALGAETVLVLPPSGDELLSAATLVRSRHAAERELVTVRQGREDARMMLASAERLAQLAGEPSPDLAHATLLQVLTQAVGAGSGALFTQAEGSRPRLVLRSTVGASTGLPASVEDAGALAAVAKERGLDGIQLSLSGAPVGHVLVDAVAARQGLPVLLAQAAATLTAIAARRPAAIEGAGGLKDDETSAYTLAYFADLAGREIDRASRLGRRFALAIVAPMAGVVPKRTPLEVSEALLDAVRDSDVVARVDGHEFYVLLPDTTGVSAHGLRRKLEDRDALDAGMSVGIAAYPHDGTDLLTLLHAAKRRAEAYAASVVPQLQLGKRTLPELVEALAWGEGRSAPSAQDSPVTVELTRSELFSLARIAVSHAAFAGTPRVVVTATDGVGAASAVRSHPATASASAHAEHDIRHRDGCEELEVLCLYAEHGAFALAGRLTRDRFVGAQSSDPRLVDLLSSRLAELSGRGASSWVGR